MPKASAASISSLFIGAGEGLFRPSMQTSYKQEGFSSNKKALSEDRAFNPPTADKYQEQLSQQRKRLTIFTVDNNRLCLYNP